MSPNEAQLRAALREGAGGGVDADLIIARAERHRRARRQRISYAAAAVIVAAFVGVGGTLLADNGSSGDSAGNADNTASGGGAAVGRVPHATSSRGETVPSPAGSNADGGFGAAPNTSACPPTPTRVVIPDHAAGGRAGRLLPADVSTITACAYPSGARSARTAVVSGSQARGLAATLNHGAVDPQAYNRTCRAGDDAGGQVALLPADANGRRARTVVVTVHCSRAVATNGTATRYLATVPPVINGLMR